MRKLISAIAGVGMIAGLTAAPAGADEMRPTITDAVISISGASGFDDNAGDFDILREALVATGLASVLDEPGTYSVFAPTDQAFLDITGTATEDEAFAVAAAYGIPTVTEVLLYHVAPGRYPASRVIDRVRIPTIQGEIITKARGSLTLIDTQGRESNIVAGNAVKASNGVVHVIDAVLLPFPA